MSLLFAYGIRQFFKPELVHVFEINLPKFMDSKGKFRWKKNNISLVENI